MIQLVKWNFENVSEAILRLCCKLGRAPTIREIQKCDYTPTSKVMIKRIMNENGYNNHIMFCINNNYLPNKIYARDLNYDILCKIFDNFYSVNNFLPTRDDLNWSRYNLPNLLVIGEICGDKLKEFKNKYKLNTKYYYYPEPYNFYCNKFVKIYNSEDIGARYIYGNYNLPTLKWFIDNCPKKINSSNDFIDYLGLIPRKYISKEQAIKAVLETKKSLSRNLMYDDFRNNKFINISTINRIWGTFNNMLQDLNMPINQEDMVHKHKTIDKLEIDIINLCNYIKINENRINISYDDINNCEWCLNSQSYNKFFTNELNMTLSEYIKSKGFIPNEAGCGMNYTFPDGEKTLSQWEYQTSTYLRDKNIIYERNIKYKDFIPNYKGNKDCDYKINDWYVEVAGILDYTKTYGEDKIHKKYKKDLQEKENMFIENNINYKIIYPEDIRNTSMDKLFSFVI